VLILFQFILVHGIRATHSDYCDRQFRLRIIESSYRFTDPSVHQSVYRFYTKYWVKSVDNW